LLINFCDASSFLTWISQSAHLHLVSLHASNLDSFFLRQRFFCARLSTRWILFVPPPQKPSPGFLVLLPLHGFFSADSVFGFGFPTSRFLHSLISRPRALVFGERASIHPVFPSRSWASVFLAADLIFAPRSAAHRWILASVELIPCSDHAASGARYLCGVAQLLLIFSSSIAVWQVVIFPIC
jgi:hypothetical protein